MRKRQTGMLFGMSLEMLREHIKPNGPDAASTINYTFFAMTPSQSWNQHSW